MVRFSARTEWDTAEGALATAVRLARTCGQPVLDLTVANPTLCGFEYDPLLLQGLTAPAALVYDPDPRGLRVAREAVSTYYAGHQASVDPDHVVLTTSTSEAYSFLFRLLADAGDAILTAVPGYPLFDFLAALDQVALTTYPLFYDFGWWIDLAELERRITPRTRALVVVHPNNPTGHATTRAQRAVLEEVCVRHDLALIVDEVFLDYGLQGAIESFATGPHPCLTFVVSGLSKVAALPQMKLGWLAAFGPDTIRENALSRLEIIADTFLSMNTPMQLAMPGWLGGRKAMQRQILARVQSNLGVLTRARTLQVLPVEAGWCAVVRLPQWVLAERDLAERLVREAGVLTHAGSFYGMPERNRLVVSLLGPPEVFAAGVQELVHWCESTGLALGESGSCGGLGACA